MSRDMSVVNAVNARAEERKATALESIADSLKGICQDVWEIKTMMEERKAREEAAGK